MPRTPNRTVKLTVESLERRELPSSLITPPPAGSYTVVGSTTASAIDRYASGYTVALTGHLDYQAGLSRNHNETLVRTTRSRTPRSRRR